MGIEAHSFKEMLLSNRKEQSVCCRQIRVNFDYIILCEECHIQKEHVFFFNLYSILKETKLQAKGKEID